VSLKKIIKAQKKYSRLDHFLKECLPDKSRTEIGHLIKNRKVKLNGTIILKKSREVFENDTVEIQIEEAAEKTIYSSPLYHPSIQLTKLFEDDYLLIIDKPCGIAVHPGAGKSEETILDIYRFYYPQIMDIKNTERPGIVHRIDKDTSGILILAKDEIGMKRMQKKFKNREVDKTYLALVSGKMRFKNGTINAPISRHLKKRTKYTVPHRENHNNSREAITVYTVLLEFQHSSLVRLSPLTGRTHQIRVHLSHIGNPILGDKTYGKLKTFPRLALHAYAAEFVHPIIQNHIATTTPMPQIFRDYIQKELIMNTDNNEKST
jgi:23S rRNA pseudouridine1911/1915/1917 synthase